jgi:hypothetical protein
MNQGNDKDILTKDRKSAQPWNLTEAGWSRHSEKKSSGDPAALPKISEKKVTDTDDPLKQHNATNEVRGHRK